MLNPEASDGLIYLRKLNMQLASKMRFVSAQLIALLEGDLWLRNARARQRDGRAAARGVEAGCRRLDRGVRFTQPTQANAVFAMLPHGVADRLRERFRFYDWDPATGEVRWMCAFDTTEADVDAFVAELARLPPPEDVRDVRGHSCRMDALNPPDRWSSDSTHRSESRHP